MFVACCLLIDVWSFGVWWLVFVATCSVGPCSLFVVCHMLFDARCVLFVAYCLLFVVCRS